MTGPLTNLVRVFLVSSVLALSVLAVMAASAQAEGLGRGDFTVDTDVEMQSRSDLSAGTGDVGAASADATTAVTSTATAAGSAVPQLSVDSDDLSVIARGLVGRDGHGDVGLDGIVGSGPEPRVASHPGAEAPLVLSSTEAATIGAVALGTAGGVGLLFWAKNSILFILSRFLAAPLFSRLDKGELLANEGRETLLQLVQNNPGIALKELSDNAAMGWGTTVYHLGRLESAGYLVSMKHGASRHFFVNGHPAARSKQAIAVLKNQTAQDVGRFLLATPGATQTTIGEGLGLGAPTVSKFVKRLQAEGLVSVVADGRTKIVQPTESLAEAMGHLELSMPTLKVAAWSSQEAAAAVA